MLRALKKAKLKNLGFTSKFKFWYEFWNNFFFKRWKILWKRSWMKCRKKTDTRQNLIVNWNLCFNFHQLENENLVKMKRGKFFNVVNPSFSRKIENSKEICILANILPRFIFARFSEILIILQAKRIRFENTQQLPNGNAT